MMRFFNSSIKFKKIQCWTFLETNQAQYIIVGISILLKFWSNVCHITGCVFPFFRSRLLSTKYLSMVPGAHNRCTKRKSHYLLIMETQNSLGDDAESFQTMILSPMDDDISDDEEEDDDTSVRLREKTSQILATYQDYLSDIESSTSTTNDPFISKTKIYSSSSISSSSRSKNDVNLHDIAHLRRYESHYKQQYSIEMRMKAQKHLITLTMCFLSVMCVSAVVSIAKSVRSQRVFPDLNGELDTARNNEDPLTDINAGRTGMAFSNAATGDVEFDLEQLHENFLSKQHQSKRHYDETASLYKTIYSKYSPQLFSRESGWSGTTTIEAIKFCDSKMNGVVCPYEVYCPEGSHSLPYGGVRDESNAWGFIPQWAATSNGHWVSLSLENSCVLWGALHDGAPLWDSSGGNESETRHLMCCQKTGNLD